MGWNSISVTGEKSILNQFNNEKYFDLKLIQKELVFLRKNWKTYSSSKYFLRYSAYRKLIRTPKQKPVARNHQVPIV